MTSNAANAPADLARGALDLMRATLPEGDDATVDERLRLVDDLIASTQDDTELLATWLRRAIQD